MLASEEAAAGVPGTADVCETGAEQGTVGGDSSILPYRPNTATIQPSMASMLARLDQAKQALAEVHSIKDTKDIRDKVQAVAAYLKQQEDSLEAQNYAAEIKLRAERKLGELLKEQPKNEGTKGQLSGSCIVQPPAQPPKLSDLGIEKTQSHRWQKIADIPEPAFDEYIEEQKEKGEVTTAGALNLARKLTTESHLTGASDIPLPDGIFHTIEADPPWVLDANEGKSAVIQYNLMDLEAIKALGSQVLERSADDCHLWLWAINPMLPEAFEVMKAWGFEYKSCLTWVKTNGFGTGHYLRGATEHCLLGIRGSLKCLRNDQRTYFEAPRSQHSAKPDEFYELIETLSPGPRLRLFARSQLDGWDSWGDEA
jgi:N6-adenosine-specific RNA methylase IME4